MKDLGPTGLPLRARVGWVVLAAAVAGVAAGCSRSAPPPSSAATPPAGSADAGLERGVSDLQERQQAALARLVSRQKAACRQFCTRQTACAVEDARKTLGREELAALDLDTTAPLHTRKCVETCEAWEMSQRQVKVFEVCNGQGTDCAAYLRCLDAAQAQQR